MVRKYLVPVIIGRGPRESKYNLTAGTLVIHWFWRCAQNTHIHTQRHTAVLPALPKIRGDVMPDADTACRCTGHCPYIEPPKAQLALILPKVTWFLLYLACSKNLPLATFSLSISTEYTSSAGRERDSSKPDLHQFFH